MVQVEAGLVRSQTTRDLIDQVKDLDYLWKVTEGFFGLCVCHEIILKIILIAAKYELAQKDVRVYEEKPVRWRLF